jgi:integrase
MPTTKKAAGLKIKAMDSTKVTPAAIRAAKKILRAAEESGMQDAILAALMQRKTVPVKQALAEWHLWRKANSSASTLRTNRLALDQFFDGLEAANWPVSKITIQHIDAWVNKDDACKRATREAKLAAIRSFYKFVTANAYCQTNPAQLVHVRIRDMTHAQLERTVREPITEHEYRHIMANTEGFWKWATAISYWAGLRMSDVFALQWAQIMPTEIVAWAKKDGDRLVLPLNHPLIGGGELVPVLFEVLSNRQDDTYCFPDQHREMADIEKRSKFSVYYTRLLAGLGIEGKSFHSLRHAFATRLANAGVTPEQIGRWMGHSSTRITEGYIHRGKR